ncbi:hypothetical protein EDD27_3188 [Nonomuraea polychroma]|uniref:Uncharacterized protein n=1 Tax=Nonomuraea polychroma TaxID=46176 RepID=A0A438M4J9_9ACTN|nr:hypothetical protein EDD27_3188 [Nonomuraea polychroma]
MPTGPGNPTFTVQRITSRKVHFLVTYPARNRATLDLAPLDFAPFGDFRITLEEIDGRKAVVSVSAPGLP